jgi:hypothetical protein
MYFLFIFKLKLKFKILVEIKDLKYQQHLGK